MEDLSVLNKLPVLPLRDVVVYPYAVIPLFVGRGKSIAALNQSMSQEKKILVVTQKSASKDDPCAGDLYSVGTLATILQILELPDGTVKVLIEGVERVKIKAIEDIDEYLLSEYEIHFQLESLMILRWRRSCGWH